MKKGKFGLALFSVLVLLAVLVMAIHTTPEPAPASPAVILAGAEQVELWSPDGETYYAFLPSHADPDRMQLVSRADQVTLNGASLPQPLAVQETYELCWQEQGREYRAALKILPSAGLPTLYLDTQSGSMDVIHAEKGSAERGTARLYDETGTLTFRDSFSSLRGRGNSTWDVPEKKPYNLDLSEEADLLGMGVAKNWILLADALDASSLRNKIAYEFASDIGMEYAPRSRWTEVYLNGEYAGLYLLCQRIENEPGRLELGRDGVVLRMDRDTRIEPEADPYFVTDAGLYLQILDGRDSTALHQRFQQMEDALLSGSGSWQDCIDLDSWVKQYLMEEVFGSYDAGFQSQYFYLRDTAPGSRIYAGPVWDYDSALGNPTILALQSPRGLFAWRPEAMPEYATPWYNSLYGREDFREEVIRQYQELVVPELEQLLTRTLEDYTGEIGASFERNRLRWTVETEGLEAEAAHIRDWLTQRRTFLDDLWLEENPFHIVRIRDDGNFYIYYAMESGSSLLDLPYMAENTQAVWYRVDTGEVWDLSAPVREDLLLDTELPSGAPEQKQQSLMDRFLVVYHYVPVLVLAAMGLATVPAALWMSRGRSSRQKSKV